MSAEQSTKPERQVPWMAGYLSYPPLAPIVEVAPVTEPEPPDQS